MQVFGSSSITYPKHTVPTEHLLLSNKQNLIPSMFTSLSSCSCWGSVANQGDCSQEGSECFALFQGASEHVQPQKGSSASKAPAERRARDSGRARRCANEGGGVEFIEHVLRLSALLASGNSAADTPSRTLLRGSL